MPNFNQCYIIVDKTTVGVYSNRVVYKIEQGDAYYESKNYRST